MGDKIIDSSIEWIKDKESGEVVGYKMANGEERAIVSATQDLTGGISFSTLGQGAGFAYPATQKQVTFKLTDSGTFNPPLWADVLVVEMIGGGGGGSGSGGGSPGAGGDGGSTSFGALRCTGGKGATIPTGYANGGGAGGFPTQGDVNIPGQAGGNSIPGLTYKEGGKGGDTPIGRNIASNGSSPSVSPPSSSGCGGNGGGSNGTATTGAGGGAGGYMRKVIYPVVGPYAYTAGIGGLAGTAGTSGNAGAAGAGGVIIVTCVSLLRAQKTMTGIYPYYADGSTNHLSEFETWLGRPADEVLAFIKADTWSAMRTASYNTTQNPVLKSNKPAWTLALTCPGTTLAQVAAGSNDADFTYIAQQIAITQPTGEIRLRLGWEQNGGWYAWSSNGVEANYISAWRRVVGLMRAVSPRFVFEWAPCYTVYVNSVVVNSELSYPGDDYVDVIGLSCYYDTRIDNINPLWAFGDKRDSTYGLDWHVSFAKAHQKRIVLSEWGVNGDGKELFVRAMSQWIKAHQYEAHNYWDSNSSISCAMSNNQYPTTSAEFIAQFAKY